MHGKKVQFGLSLSQALADKLDKKLAQIEAKNGGVKVTRTALIESLLEQSLGGK